MNNLNTKGISLLEVVVAMAIFIAIIGSITGVLLFSLKSNKIVFEQLSTQNEGRKIIQDFVNELRTASASSIGAYPIELAEDNQIIFYSNIDKDTYRERIRYFMDGNILKKGIIKPSGNPLRYLSNTEQIVDVVHDVANGQVPIFSYYSQSFSGSEEPLAFPVNIGDVRMVRISLELEEDPRASPVPFHIESKVGIRNLKSN